MTTMLEHELNLATARLQETKLLNERLQVQLAGCLTAAEGATDPAQVAQQGDYGWSMAYQKTLELRRKFDGHQLLLRWLHDYFFTQLGNLAADKGDEQGCAEARYILDLFKAPAPPAPPALPPVPAGCERIFCKCKCGKAHYYDIVPYSLSTPIITLRCGCRIEDTHAITEEECMRLRTP